MDILTMKSKQTCNIHTVWHCRLLTGHRILVTEHSGDLGWSIYTLSWYEWLGCRVWQPLENITDPCLCIIPLCRFVLLTPLSTKWNMIDWLTNSWFWLTSTETGTNIVSSLSLCNQLHFFNVDNGTGWWWVWVSTSPHDSCK